jgi:hypothetical protein
VRATRNWLILAVVLAALLLVAVVLALAVVGPPAMDPVPLPTASAL